MLNDYGKLYLLGLAMILGAVFSGILAVAGEVTAAVGVFGTTVGTCVGYLTGNGVLAARTEAPSPVFVPTPEAVVEKTLSEARDIVTDLEAMDESRKHE